MPYNQFSVINRKKMKNQFWNQQGGFKKLTYKNRFIYFLFRRLMKGTCLYVKTRVWRNGHLLSAPLKPLLTEIQSGGRRLISSPDTFSCPCFFVLISKLENTLNSRMTQNCWTHIYSHFFTQKGSYWRSTTCRRIISAESFWRTQTIDKFVCPTDSFKKKNLSANLYSGTLETRVNCGKMNNERQTFAIFW